jgi:hypothetical protein
MRDRLVGAIVDEAAYERIRRAAFEERCSMSEVIRRAIEVYLTRQPKGKKGKL